MWLARLAAPLLLAVGSYGINSCFTDGSCSTGSTRLKLKDCGITDEDFSGLALCFEHAGRGTIESVDLTDNDITSVPGDAFDGMPSLEWLSFDNNDIHSLEAGVFSGAPALEYLELDDNYLTTLPQGFFDGTGENLTQLYLRSNELSELPTGIFKDLTSLEKLYMQSNNFTTLPARFLEGLVSLENLYLSSNDLVSLPKDFCKSTPSLDRLSLSNTELESIPSSTFDGCGNITYLFLVYNKLMALPEDIFHDLAILEYLDIRGNELSTLPATIFEGTPALEKLYVRDNQLDILPLGIFDATPALRSLDLEKNVGMTVPAGLFDGLASLTYLNLGDSEHVSVANGVFDGLVGLEDLYLDGNNLTTLPAGLFDDLESLDYLQLNDNNLTTLPAGLFDDLESLVYLWLRGNEGLQCIPETLAKNLRLDDDDVEESGICECPEEPTCDENGDACDCQPGADGFSCGTGSSSEVIRAFSCSSPDPSTGGHVDAGERTTVGVEASGFDERTSGYGCSPAGCTADNTRDGNLDANSRWSCKGDLVGDDGGLCCIDYSFEDPQDIVAIEIAFYKGTEETRTLNVYDNNELHSRIQSSGSSVSYQEFALNTDGTADLRLCLDDPESNGDVWLSITEVQLMVK